MALYGNAVENAFRRILVSALRTIDDYVFVVKTKHLPQIEIGPPDASISDTDHLKDVLEAVSRQFFQDPDHLGKWVEAIANLYGDRSKVKDALESYKKELAKPSLWVINDCTDSEISIYDDHTIQETIEFTLKDRYRLDNYTPLPERSLFNLDDDRADFDSAGCIVITKSDGPNSVAQDLVRNIVRLAHLKVQSAGNMAPPRIIFTANSRESAVALKEEIVGMWPGESTPPFLFLMPSSDRTEIANQRTKAQEFFGRGIDPPPPKNDLIILVGGMVTTDDDAVRFNKLRHLIGDHTSLKVLEPWREIDHSLPWDSELRRRLDTATNPLLVEHIRADASEDEAYVFADYLTLAVNTYTVGGNKITLMQTMVEQASKQRLLWKPAGNDLKVENGAELYRENPEDFARIIRGRLGLGEEFSEPPAFVAVEEVVINNKLDRKLRSALKKHLSVVVGGDGSPPSTDWVVPFSFQIAQTRDPLHRAVEHFRRSRMNVVAACDASRGNRTLKQYLTEINTRVLEGVNSYFSDKIGLAPDPDQIFHILVKIGDLNQMDTEMIDDANGNWRIVKFERKQDEYEPFSNDIETAQAWVNDQLP
ncbi:hypothetical protein [Rhizobium leguminosarum]